MILDWMGNEIKFGMEMCIIQVIDRNYCRPDKPDWKILETYEICENEDELLCYINTEEIEGYYPLSFLTSFRFDNSKIIAIKGISDNREEYEQYRIS